MRRRTLTILLSVFRWPQGNRNIVLIAQTGIDSFSSVYHLVMRQSPEGDYYPACQSNLSYPHMISHSAAILGGLRMCERCASYNKVLGGLL